MVTVILVGMPGSGKDIFVQEAARAGFNHIRMGDMVRRFAREAGIDAGDSSIGGFATGQREKYGPDIWAVRTLERLPGGDVLIDGSRSLAEIERFKIVLGDGLRVIGIDAPADMRFRRLAARGREDDPSTREQFRKRDERELSWGLGEAMKAAGLVLVNDGTLEQFRDRCQAAILSLRETHGKPL